MPSIDYQIPFILDSGNATASEKTDDGSQFTVNLETPMVIPHNAAYCYVTVYDATVWNTVYNIEEGVNDTFYVDYDDGVPVSETLIILPGLYDVDHLNSALNRELTNNANLPSDLFIIVPDTASSRSVIQFNYPLTQIDFTQTDTLRLMLGFDSRLVPLVVTTGVQYEISDNIAQFNNLEYFTIGSDLVHKGIRINDKYNQTLVRVPVLASPGSQVNYQAQNPPRIPANELIGAKKKTFTVWLTNDRLERVNTSGESFSISLSVHYVVKDTDSILDY